jgi:hypothetical protein
LIWWQIVIAIGGFIGIPGLILFYIKRRFDKHDEQETERSEFLFLVMKSSIASVSLGEAAAVCIKEGKVNGELTDAKVYACSTKNEIRDFAQRRGIKNLI